MLYQFIFDYVNLIDHSKFDMFLLSESNFDYFHRILCSYGVFVGHYDNILGFYLLFYGLFIFIVYVCILRFFYNSLFINFGGSVNKNNSSNVESIQLHNFIYILFGFLSFFLFVCLLFFFNHGYNSLIVNSIQFGLLYNDTIYSLGCYLDLVFLYHTLEIPIIQTNDDVDALYSWLFFEYLTNPKNVCVRSFMSDGEVSRALNYYFIEVNAFLHYRPSPWSVTERGVLFITYCRQLGYLQTVTDYDLVLPMKFDYLVTWLVNWDYVYTKLTSYSSYGSSIINYFQLKNIFRLSFNKIQGFYYLDNLVFITDGSNFVKVSLLFFSLCISLFFMFRCSILQFSLNLLVIELPLFMFLIIWCFLMLVDINTFGITFLFLELITFVGCILIMLNNNVLLSLESSIKYYLANASGSFFILFSLFILYSLTSYEAFDLLYWSIYILMSKTLLWNINYSVFIYLSFFLFLFGFLIKIGSFPFHMWLIDVYEGSAIEITLILSVIVKFGYIIIFFKLFLLIYNSVLINNVYILYCICIGSLFFGACGALFQERIKRFLGFNSVVHFGFLFSGFCMFSFSGLLSSIVYLHVYVLTTLFFFINISLIGPISNYINNLVFVSTRFPFLTFNLLLLLLSSAGIPPLLGFFSKFLIIYSVTSNFLVILIGFLLFFTLVSTYNYLRLIKNIYFLTEPVNTFKSLNSEDFVVYENEYYWGLVDENDGYAHLIVARLYKSMLHPLADKGRLPYYVFPWYLFSFILILFFVFSWFVWDNLLIYNSTFIIFFSNFWNLL